MSPTFCSGFWSLISGVWFHIFCHSLGSLSCGCRVSLLYCFCNEPRTHCCGRPLLVNFPFLFCICTYPLNSILILYPGVFLWCLYVMVLSASVMFVRRFVVELYWLTPFQTSLDAVGASASMAISHPHNGFRTPWAFEIVY